MTPPVTDAEGEYFFWFVFKDINTWSGCVVCSTYQTRVLSLFNELRHGVDSAWMLNGLDYGPIQNMTIGTWWLHFATVVYASGESWAYPSRWAWIYDPWPAQKPLVFEPRWWEELVGRHTADVTTYGPNPNMPSYVPKYPIYQEHEGYPESGTGMGIERPEHTGCAVKTIVATESPIEVGFTEPSGDRIGYFGREWVSEVDDPFGYSALSIPQLGGHAGQLIFLPTSEGQLTVTGTAAGTFKLHVGYQTSSGWEWASYRALITTGEPVTFVIAGSDPCTAGARSDGTPVPLDGACPQSNLPVDESLKSGCGCRSEPGSASWWGPLALLGLLGLVFTRRAFRS